MDLGKQVPTVTSSSAAFSLSDPGSRTLLKIAQTDDQVLGTLRGR